MNETSVHTEIRYKYAILGVLAFALSLGLAFIYGFMVFTRMQPLVHNLPVGQADGVVVLTGGAQRISQAMKLLSQGRAKRLLISGVHPNTTLGELARKYAGFDHYFKCCVDLDYKALNTIGNALETFHWTRTYKHNSLIIVTSAYHMPRSLLELRHVLPKIKLYSYPVIRKQVNKAKKINSGSWWVNPFKERLLFSEYIKYILARTRIALFAPQPRSLP